MGVPGFFAYLYKNFSNKYNLVLRKNNIQNFDKHNLSVINNLYIDTNCLIHPEASKVCEAYKHLINPEQIHILEHKIIIACIKYITKLIDETKPTDLIYIAIDGVAPMAKIKHQRQRRFKYMYDNDLMNEIKMKHNKPIESKWNTSSITPGTIFMTKLTKGIIDWINSNNLGAKVIFSSCYTPGEGEHKILQDLKSNQNKVNVVYGLDADLIFLSLSSNISNIYLLRETTILESKIENLSKEDEFSYIDIDILKEIIYVEMSKNISDK